MVLPFSGCGSKNSSNNAESTSNAKGNTSGGVAVAKNTKKGSGRIISESDPFFDAKISELKVKVPTGKDILYTEFTSAYAVGDRILANVHIEYKKPLEVEKEMNNLNLDDEKQQKRYMDIWNEYSVNSMQLFDLEGNNISSVELDKGCEFSNAYSLDNGEILVVTTKVNMNDCTAQPSLTVLSSSGEKLREITLDANEALSGARVYVADNGKILLASNKKISVMDPQGKLINSIESPNFDGTMLCSGGKWFAVMPQYEQEDLAVYVQEVDLNEGKLTGQKIKSDNVVLGLVQGKSDCFLLNSNGIEKYDLLDGTRTTTFSWKDTDLNSSAIQMEGGSIESEDHLVFFKMELDKEIARTDMDQKAGIGNKMSIVSLTRADKNPHAGKEVLKLAVNGIDDVSFIDRIIQYNTDPSNHARVEISDYSPDTNERWFFSNDSSRQLEGVGNLTLDMLSGNGPDILVGFSDFSQFNNENSLIDLKTYLDSDPSLKTDDYYQNIFSAFELDGKLFTMPITYTLEGMVVNGKFQGTKEKLTYSDLDKIASSLPSDIQLLDSHDYNDLLTKLLYVSSDRFVNNVDKTVNFDSDEFREMLETVKKYGKTSQDGQSSNLPLGESGFMNGEVLFGMGMIASSNVLLRGLTDFTYLGSVNSGDYIYSGYPTKDGMGMTAVGDITMSITTSAANPNQAWEFIRFFLNEDIQQDLCFNMDKLPVNKKAFDSKCKTEIEVSEQALESYKKNHGNSADDDYMPYVLTQQDKDKLASLIASVETAQQFDSDVLNIVLEEAAGFFEGQRSVDDVCKNIQSRASIVVQER